MDIQRLLIVMGLVILVAGIIWPILYEDWAEPERKRHLLRLWLCPPNGRPLPPVFADRYGGTEIGNRGGIVLPGVSMTTPLEAC